MKGKKVVVLGAGISGLATAYLLNKEGFEVTILEQNSKPGGAMITDSKNGYLIDYGPNSGLETTPLIKQIAEGVGISDQMIYANEQANKRYILKNGSLLPLPTSPPAFLKSTLFSVKAKLRLMREPFIGKSDDGCNQSLGAFVKRRLGQEFLDYAIDPFVSGVFAGDPNKLSVKSAFPKLYRLEELYGGLIKGMIQGARERKKRNEVSKQHAKMFSFRNGMQSFPQAIADYLHDAVIQDTTVENIVKLNNGYKITYKQNGEFSSIETDVILSTIPAYKAATVFSAIDQELSNHLLKIFYPKVLLLYLGFKKSDIALPLDGFGFLNPTKENKNFLGAIWSSTIFENRSSHNTASFTLFVGGAQKQNMFEEHDEQFLIDRATNEFKNIMKIKAKPEFCTTKLWDHAIPQYNVGYIEHENYFEKFEKVNPGLFLSGNYRGGISVGDCIKNADKVFNAIRDYVNS